tara:strand:+ start:3423 stop:3734 length:312 start_codon:yes stop_codon:yes gene_type:complete
MPQKKNKKEIVKEDTRILEYKGWKAGDRCYTVFSGDSRPSLCDILFFHVDDDIAPAASVSDIATGKYRVTPVMTIAETAKDAKDLKPAWEKYLKKYKKKKLKE